MKRVWIMALVLAAACDDEQLPESANLRRPAGILEVQRPAEGTDTFRSDVFLVDSEAQGVRVLQYRRFLDPNPPEGRLPVEIASSQFLPAPVVYFPLVVTAPGFPTRIAANAAGDHAFVIAPADVGLELDEVRRAKSVLHVLSTPGLMFGARVAPGQYVRLDGMDLTNAVMPGVFFPVDIVSLGAPSADADRIAVAFDELGSASSRIMIYDLPKTIAPQPESATTLDPQAALVRDITVRGGVTRMVLHGDPPRIYTTSVLASATSSTADVITEIDPDTGATRSLAAGGPTIDLVSAGAFGLLALRADIPSVVVFPGDPPARSTQIYPSPFTPLEERVSDPDLPGRIDLRDSALGPGAYAPITRGLSFRTGAVVLGERDTPVVLITHVDGFGSFLLDPPGDEGFGLGIVSPSEVDTVWLRGGAGVAVAECSNLPGLSDLKPVDEPECAGTVVANAFPTNARYRATYRGALVRSPNGRIEVLSESTTATTVRMRLTDSGIDFEDRLVQVGDEIAMRLPYPMSCDDEAPVVEQGLSGTVVGVEADAVELALDSPVAVAGRCTDPIDVYIYELFPSGEEGVLVQVGNGGIGTVVQRAPVQGTRIPFGGASPSGEAISVAFTLTAEGGFACQPTDVGYPCASLLECAEGWSCSDRPTPEGTTVAPLSTCEPAVCEAEACLELSLNRGCSGVELFVLGTSVAQTDLRSDTLQISGSVPSAAPDDAVAIAGGRTFLVSFPGARSVVEVRTSSLSLAVDQLR